MDDLTKKTNEVENNLEFTSVALNLDKEIYLIRTFEEDAEIKKKYIRNAGILIGNVILTSTFADTVHFLEEIYLFDIGNDQNKYLNVTEYKKTRNLKLKMDSDENIFISKSEARAICKLFNLSLMGYSISRVLENEYRFTPQNLTTFLHQNKYLEK